MFRVTRLRHSQRLTRMSGQPLRLAGPVAIPCQQVPGDGRHVPGAVDHGDINGLAAALLVDLRQSGH